MKSSRSRSRVLFVFATLMIALASHTAGAQPSPLQPDLDPDVLDLERPATETGCFSTSYIAHGVCSEARTMKADRWLQIIVAGCMKKAEAWTPERNALLEKSPALAAEVKQMASETDQAVWLRRVQDAWERYRDLESRSVHDEVLPGMQARHHQYNTYLDLTLERATKLYRCCTGGNDPPPKVIDLTKKWCEYQPLPRLRVAPRHRPGGR